MRRSTLAALAAVAALLGCNADPGVGNGEGIDAPPPCPACGKASGMVAQGSIIPDFSFEGFVGGDVQTLAGITIYDFYNPHAGDASYAPADPSEDDRLFPPGSPYGGGTKKPTALLIDIASVWCGPCNEEAKDTLNVLYAKYKPCGGEFFFQLAEGGSPGAPVTPQLLSTWISMYHLTYPAVWDPSKQLFPIYNADAFPDSAIVDTRTMRLVDVVSGVADTAFWSTYEAHLDAACLAGG
jgi:hypothetical protein